MEWAFDREQAMLIVWSLFLAAVMSVVARLIARRRIFGQFLLDDYLALFALFCLLADDLIFTIALPVFETIQSVSYYHHRPPSNFKPTVLKFLKTQWAIAYIYFTGLWAVKAVFLVCYWKLTEDLKTFRRAWYILVAFVVLTYIGCLVAYPLLNYVQHHHVESFKTLSIKYQFAADLSTDIMIAALPITLFLRASLTPVRRLNLTFLSALSLLATCVAVARYVIDAPNGRNYGTLWLTVWSMVELSVAIMVASLIVVRSFVARKREGGNAGYGSPVHSEARMISAFEFEGKGVRKMPWLSGMWRSKKEPWPKQEGVLERPRGAKLSRLSSSKYLSGGSDLYLYRDTRGADLPEDLIWA